MNEDKDTTETQNLSKIATALSKAQGVMNGAKKNSNNPFFKSSYSSLSSIFDAIREPFCLNGLAVTQTVDVLPNGSQVLCTRLLHASGEYIDSKMLLPPEANPQKLGSLITYLRRYSLMAIAGISSEDDDGNSAAGHAPPRPRFISLEQIKNLEEIINGNSRVRKLVLENSNGSMSTITEDRYEGALKWIKSELAKDRAE